MDREISSQNGRATARPFCSSISINDIELHLAFLRLLARRRTRTPFADDNIIDLATDYKKKS